MKAFKMYFALWVIALGLSASCFAAQNANTLCDQSQSYSNYYIQPGGVYLAPNGIYASIDGVLIQIKTLCSDDKGIFVPYEEIVGELEYCPFCQSWYDPEYGHSCDGPRD